MEVPERNEIEAQRFSLLDLPSQDGHTRYPRSGRCADCRAQYLACAAFGIRIEVEASIEQAGFKDIGIPTTQAGRGYMRDGMCQLPLGSSMNTTCKKEVKGAEKATVEEEAGE
jgi:hypothetical protein